MFVAKRRLLRAAACLDESTNRAAERDDFSFLYSHVHNKIRKISESILSVLLTQ